MDFIVIIINKYLEEMKNDELYEKIIFKYYYLQTPQELLKNGAGICFDQVELEKYWFKNHGYKTYSYFCDFHNHSFLIYEDNKKFYLFERTYKELNGIHKENSLEEVLKYYTKMQLKIITLKR